MEEWQSLASLHEPSVNLVFGSGVPVSGPMAASLSIPTDNTSPNPLPFSFSFLVSTRHSIRDPQWQQDCVQLADAGSTGNTIRFLI